jgi:hypothetical protein
MANLEQRLNDFATIVGTDIKTLNSILGGGTANVATAVGATGDKTVVQALAVLKDAITVVAASTDIISDTALTTTTNKTYSIAKISELLATLETKVLGGIAPSALDTIKELADYLSGEGIAGNIVDKLSKKVDVDSVQTFTSAQQEQARININAASTTALLGLATAVGNTDQNLVSIYTAAKTT